MLPRFSLLHSDRRGREVGLVGEEIGRGQCGDLAALADIADGRGWDLLPRGRSRAGVGNLPLGAAAANTREKLREGVRSAVAPGWSGWRPDRDCALPQPLLLPPPSDRPGPARKSHWELCLDPATLSPVLKPFLSPPPIYFFNVRLVSRHREFRVPHSYYK